MKRIILFLLVSTSAVGSVYAQRGADSVRLNIVGGHAGYCVSWVTSCGLRSSARSGYEAGVTDRIRLTGRLPLHLRTGASFISKGYEISGFDDSRTTMRYIQIPVAVDYTVAVTRNLSLIPFAGLYYAVGVGGKRKAGDTTVPIFGKRGGFSRHDTGFMCGADAAVGRFVIGADYGMGFIDIDKTDTMYGEGSDKVGYRHVRNRCFVVRAGIIF